MKLNTALMPIILLISSTLGTAYAAPVVNCNALVDAFALKVSSESIGVSGAMDVRSVSTGEIVRVMLSQTGRNRNLVQDRYDFAVIGLKAITPRGSLLQAFSEFTNIQFLASDFEGRGKFGQCIVSFDGREVDRETEFFGKTVSSLSRGYVKLAPSESQQVPAVLNEALEWKAHGKNLD